MQAIIVCDGLTKDILSLEHPYQTSKSSVGRREIERLMGKGKAFGNGPLPVFLREAIEARSRGSIAVRVVLLKEEEGGSGSELVEPIAELAERCRGDPDRFRRHSLESSRGRVRRRRRADGSVRHCGPRPRLPHGEASS